MAAAKGVDDQVEMSPVQAHDKSNPISSSQQQQQQIAVSMDMRAGKLRRETKLPITFVLERLKLSVDQSELTSDFLVFLPFLALFIFYFLVGRDVEGNFYILRTVKLAATLPSYPLISTQLSIYQSQVLAGDRLWVELDKDYPGIGNAGDYKDWIGDTLMQFIYPCSGGANTSRGFDFLAPFGQSYHLGALRIRVQHVRSDSCTVFTDIYPANTTRMKRTCYAAVADSSTEMTGGVICNKTSPLNSNETLFQYKQCKDIPGVPISAIEGVYHCGGYMVEIPFSASCDTAKAVQQALYDNCFVNQWSTRFIAAEYFMYTPSTDSFHSIKFYSEVPPSGIWYNQWQLRSFQLFAATQASTLAIEIVFFLYVMYWVFRFVYDIVKTVRDPELSLLSFLTDFWTLLEIVNLGVFIAMFAVRWSWWAVSSEAAPYLKLPMSPVYPKYLDRLQVLFEAQVYGGSVNTVLIFLKLLKYVRLNARLNVLTRTLAACQQSIIGVLVLFVTVIFGYAITAWSLFGTNLRAFRSLGVSMSSLVRMLVGDIDYEAMRRENRFLSAAFFWTYIILALFLLLNFLIAIISESFAQTSGKAFSQPLDETIIRSWQSAKAFFRPSNIGRMIRNRCSGKSEPIMLRKVIEQLEERLKTILLIEAQARAERSSKSDLRASTALIESDADGTSSVDDVTMQFDNLVEWIDEETYATLSEHFFTYLWDDLMNEFDDKRKGSEETEKRRMAETVENMVLKMLSEDIARVDQLDELLNSLDGELNRLMQLFQVPESAVIAAQKGMSKR